MPDYAILAWQPLLRPPLPSETPLAEPSVYDAPLKALTCRNQITSAMALVTAGKSVERARLVFGDLTSERARIPAEAITPLLAGAVPTPEAGLVCDPLFPVDEFSIDKSAAFYVRIQVPRGIPSGTYRGSVALVVDGEDAALNRLEVEVANVDLPDVHDWGFFLNVWMNPAAIARRHGVEVWSEEHFQALRPYVEDLASHGQQTVVAPICREPWGSLTREPHPNSVRWTKRGDNYEFDFTAFDRYVELHEECGIDRAIHCYSIVQGPGDRAESTIEYLDAATGETRLERTNVRDESYASAWSAFFKAFARHLDRRVWLNKTYIGFDEKPRDAMLWMIAFLGEHAPDLKFSLVGNTREELYGGVDDLCVHPLFNERGIGQVAPPERSAIGVAQLLDPDNTCAVAERGPGKLITTYHICSVPPFPNAFLFSPLVESRILPFLAAQGGYGGFLRPGYNDWPDDPFTHPEWGSRPTGDTFLVYPGERGPVSSLRWEQLREGIADYELATIASANIRGPEEMVDYEQAITLACRDVDGCTKSVGDIEIARRLLIPIAEHQMGA